MKKAFAIAGYGEDVLEQKFGGMLRALSRGAPPHGGIAPGIDRIVMLLCGEENLREVVLFPMNQQRRGPADGRAVGGDAEAAARVAHQAGICRSEARVIERGTVCASDIHLRPRAVSGE